MPAKNRASTAAKTRTPSRSRARASVPSTSARKPAASSASSSENHSTFQRPPLRSWPGHGADDDDPDDYEDDGTEDLPGALEPRHSRRSRK